MTLCVWDRFLNPYFFAFSIARFAVASPLSMNWPDEQVNSRLSTACGLLLN